MSDELPSAGTTQPSGASQAAPAASAAPAAAATLLDEPAAAQPQASEGKEPASADAPKPEGGDAEGKGTDPKGEQDKPQGAPEKYEFKPVEGASLSDDVIGKFSAVAKELNLSQDAAQKMLDKVAPAIAQQQQQTVEKLSAEWMGQVKADKEIGGEKLDANLATAKKALDAFGNDGLRTLLKQTQLGNHPEVIRFFVKAGQAISEDTFVGGGLHTQAGTDAAAVLYGKQP